ncbi:MAG: DUF1559 domain-containing protein [Planctomycetes bacterium]|nr:DUF1559 domain-containing protein [Planctomycetota bacterium]
MSQFPQQNPQTPGSGFGNYSAPPPQYKASGSSNKSVLIIILIVLGVFFGGGVLTIGLLVALLPAVQSARQAARQMQDSNNLKVVGLAMHNYESVYKRLPAPAAINSKGEKVWSWRVSILPFIEEVNRYQAIDFQDMQPWNNPKNKVLQEASPAVFQSVHVNHPPGSQACNVFVISAPEPASVSPIFVEGENTRLPEIIDGTSYTLLAIMLRKHSTEWANPANLTVDEAYGYIQQEDQDVLAVFADGSVRSLPVNIDRATFEAMVTRNGGEVVDLPE